MSRAAFEAWMCLPHHSGDIFEDNGDYESPMTQFAWEAYQAAESATARTCAEIAGLYGSCTGREVLVQIKAIYPEAFK